MAQIHPKYKILVLHTDTGIIRTDTSTLLAADQENNKLLFRALNSEYFVQDDCNESITIVEIEQAEEIWRTMPIKIVSDLISAIPNYCVGTRQNFYKRTKLVGNSY